MGERTGIAWTRSTWNGWIGCTEVSPGCDACYARELDSRHRYGGATHWGAGVPRHRTAGDAWKRPLKWDGQCALERAGGKCADPTWHGVPGFWPVFPSLCDPFDNEVPTEWHADFWRLIRATPNLTWLLLTKRIGNVQKMHPGGDYANVWIGASVVNQEEANRDIPKLLAVSGFARRFVSYEPALGPIDWGYISSAGLSGIDQIIVGGESSQGAHKARAFDLAWARSTMRYCQRQGIACFVKQLGSNPVELSAGKRAPWKAEGTTWKMLLKHRAGADPAEWPADLRLQEFP